MGLAARAELLQLKAIRVVTPVLLGDVIPLLALRTGQRDLWPDISGLGHGVSLDLSFVQNSVVQNQSVLVVQ
jgi:hypothetical protein